MAQRRTRCCRFLVAASSPSRIRGPKLWVTKKLISTSNNSHIIPKTDRASCACASNVPAIFACPVLHCLSVCLSQFVTIVCWNFCSLAFILSAALPSSAVTLVQFPSRVQVIVYDYHFGLPIHLSRKAKGNSRWMVVLSCPFLARALDQI